MSDPEGTPGQEPHSSPEQRIVRPVSRRSQHRVTLSFAAVLVLLVVIRIAGAHPLPKPSHLSPAATVSGYLTGLEHHDLGEVRNYLAPSQRPKASGLLESLARQRATVAAPTLTQVSQSQTRATVTISLQVCYEPVGKQYTCESLSRGPMGLPDQIACVRIGGNWYATTLLKPT